MINNIKVIVIYALIRQIKNIKNRYNESISNKNNLKNNS